MNIPSIVLPGAAVVDAAALSVPQVVASLATDMVVAGAYVLVLFIIVYLNRNKYISIYVPQRTYAVMFAIVFAINVSATLAAMLWPAVT